MIRAVVRESSYRFRSTFRRRRAGYLTRVVLIGLVGGVAMAAVGARRTQSSFPTYTVQKALGFTQRQLAASVAAVAVVAIVFANLVALLPGRVAAHTRTSLLLRAE